MFKNYLKIAWRNLFRNKGFSFTNLMGLTIGMTCIILIFLWVQDELTYDKFHAKYNNIYQVMANRDFNNRIFTDPNMVMPLAKSLAGGLPELKNAVVTTYRQPHTLAYGDAKLKKWGYTVSEHFFDMFSWNFIQGNAATAIPDAYSLVLTASAAKSLFGNANPINKVVRIDNEYDAKVTAIVEDVPGNSTLQFDFINSFNYAGDYVKSAMTNWQNSSWMVYVETVPGANIKQLNKHIDQVKKSHSPDDKVSTYFTFPMSKWRLYSDFENGKNIGGMISYVRLFSIIALIILLIACVNFMNLSTARSEKRAREVGIRKTLGSDKKQLIFQFFIESMILAFLSFIFSLIAVMILLPAFNAMVGKHLSLNAREPLFWTATLTIVVFTGMIAGSYPALYLSSFDPIKVLKGTFLAGRKAVLPRRILVVVQFVISIMLISATIVVYQQLQHVKDRSMGYNPNNLIMIPSTLAIDKSYSAIKNELLNTGLISNVTRTSSPITDIWWKSPAPDWNRKPANAEIIMSGLLTDVDFTKTMGIKMLQGRDFAGTPADSSSMILNKAAVEAMGLKNPIGMQMRYGKVYTVTGVMDNVIMESPFKPVDPMMVLFNNDNSGMVSVRLKEGALPQQALLHLEKIFKKFNPDFPFEYQFADQEFGKKFLTEELINKITNIFAALAIFICCIGLAGLASFTIEKRIREIGIRKVLGATVRQLLMLISAEFLRLVSIAFVIAVPLTWWLMSNWLQKYTYRIDISMWLFGAVGCIILLLTLAVVSLNTMRAAVNNPIKSLRTE